MLLDNNGVEISRFIRPYYTDKGLSGFVADQQNSYNKKVNCKAPVFVVTQDREFIGSAGRITGLVESVRVKDGEYGKLATFNLYDPDDGTYSQLRMSFDRHAKTFISCLYAADLTQPISFNVYMDRQGYPSVSMRQGGNMVKWDEEYNPIALKEQFKDLSEKDRDAKIDEKFEELVPLINAKEKANFVPVNDVDDKLFNDEDSATGSDSESKSKKVTPAKKVSDKDLTDYDDTLPF